MESETAGYIDFATPGDARKAKELLEQVQLAERERCARIVEVESAKRNSHAGVLHEAWSIEIADRIRSGE